MKISEDEVDFLWGCDPQDGARRLLEEHGVSLAMVTLGSEGCLLLTPWAACGFEGQR